MRGKRRFNNTPLLHQRHANGIHNFYCYVRLVPFGTYDDFAPSVENPHRIGVGIDRRGTVEHDQVTLLLLELCLLYTSDAADE